MIDKISETNNESRRKKISICINESNIIKYQKGKINHYNIKYQWA
jgi:hypothetical protein